MKFINRLKRFFKPKYNPPQFMEFGTSSTVNVPPGLEGFAKQFSFSPDGGKTWKTLECSDETSLKIDESPFDENKNLN